jgi:hypothetical protein
LKLTTLASAAIGSTRVVTAPAPPPNNPPVAVTDSATVSMGSAVDIAVLTNDTDADGNTLSVSHINGGAIAVDQTVSVTNGTVRRNASGTLTFTPSVLGATSFTYTVSDGAGGSSTAAVNVTVNPVMGTGQTGEVLLTNSTGPAVNSVPVATGIPFPKSHVYDVAKIEVVDPVTPTTQREAQVEPLTTWEDGSVKHAMILFLADVGASTTTHLLRYSPTTSRTAITNRITVNQAGGNTTIAHPLGITVVLNNKGDVTSVTRGGETIVTSSNLNYIEAAGGATPREFSTSNATGVVITVEESGPVRACIRIYGTFRTAAAAAGVQFVTRMYVTRYTLDFHDTIVDQESQWNENSGVPLTMLFSARKFYRRTVYAVDGTPQYRFGLESSAMASGNVTGEHYIAQNVDFPWILGSGVPAPGHVFDYSGVATGQFCPGFVNLQGSTGNKRFAAHISDFWEEGPMELTVNGSTLDLCYFSRRGVTTWDTTVGALKEFDGSNKYKRPNTLYGRSSGIAYDYRSRLSFHPVAKTDAELHQESTLYRRSAITLECRAPFTWYHDSQAHGDLTSLNADATTGQIAWAKQSNMALDYAMAPTQSGGQSGTSTSTGNMTLYGKRDRGDRARVDTDAPYMQQDTHIGGWTDIQTYLMTGEQQFLTKGVLATIHYRSVDIRHNPTIPYGNYGAPNNVYAPGGGTRFQGHNALDHDGDHDYSEHYHVSGMPDHYMLFGDRRSLDVLKETWNWIEYITRYTHKLPFVLTDKYREADRYFGYPLLGMVQANRVLNSRANHVRIADLVIYFRQWMKERSPHFGYNPDTDTKVYATSSPSAYNWPLGTPIGYNDWDDGTGMWASQRADNSYGGVTTITSPWFSMPTMEAIAQFRDAEKAWIAAGYAPTIPDLDMVLMLLMQMKYLIRFCYTESNGGMFCYSEEARPPTFSTPGDSAGSVHNTLGCNVMLYIEDMYATELAAGRIAHPEWFTETIGTKLPLLNQKYALMMLNTPAATNRKTESAYGYEKPFPPYWKRLQRMGYPKP